MQLYHLPFFSGIPRYKKYITPFECGEKKHYSWTSLQRLNAAQTHWAQCLQGPFLKLVVWGGGFQGKLWTIQLQQEFLKGFKGEPELLEIGKISLHASNKWAWHKPWESYPGESGPLSRPSHPHVLWTLSQTHRFGPHPKTKRIFGVLHCIAKGDGPK